MKNLHSIVFYALVTPAITLGASSVMAQQSNTDNRDRHQQQQQHQQNQQRQNQQQNQANPRDQGAKKSDAYNTAETRNAQGQMNRSQNRGHIDAAPTNGLQASNLIGSKVRTNDDEDIGSVDDLVIDENGQVVAIIVSVGGFLGMGQKDVAIGWDNVTRSGRPDNKELRVDVTRDDLRSAPKFAVRN